METKKSLKGMMAIGATVVVAAMLPHGAVAQPQVCTEINALGGSVPGVRCIKTADIGNRQISSNRLQANIVLGFDNDGGDFAVRDNLSENALLFEVDSVVNEVRIGRGGGLGSDTRVDADLEIYDPNFTASPTEPALFFNASSADLFVGSGNSTNPGDSGDLVVEDGNGTTTIELRGSIGRADLGRSGFGGSLRVRGDSGAVEVEIDGSRGDVTNGINGDGLVKAWCMINGDGTIGDGFRCNFTPTQTQRIGTGLYEVDFTPLSTDVRARPRSGTLDAHGVSGNGSGMIALEDRVSDASSVFVTTRDETGARADKAFVVVLH